MIKLKEYKLDDLYEIASGITSTPVQDNHGFPFLSFDTVFNNQFLPEKLANLMDTSEETERPIQLKKKIFFSQELVKLWMNLQ